MQVMLVTSDTTLLGQMYNVMNDIMQVEALERVKKRKAEGDQTDEKTLLEEELPKIVLNPNVFTDFKVSGDPEVGVIFSYQIFTRCWNRGTMVPWAFVQLLFFSPKDDMFLQNGWLKNMSYDVGYSAMVDGVVFLVW